MVSVARLGIGGGGLADLLRELDEAKEFVSSAMASGGGGARVAAGGEAEGVRRVAEALKELKGVSGNES